MNTHDQLSLPLPEFEVVDEIVAILAMLADLLQFLMMTVSSGLLIFPRIAEVYGGIIIHRGRPIEEGTPGADMLKRFFIKCSVYSVYFEILYESNIVIYIVYRQTEP